jgi:hypothetical protein
MKSPISIHLLAVAEVEAGEALIRVKPEAETGRQN